jgi:DNA-binding transcriptional activator of the SARP family
MVDAIAVRPTVRRDSGFASARDPVSIHLVGGFSVEVGDHRIALPISPSRLIAYLALQARPCSRSNLAGVLWPDGSQDRAMGNLRSVLWRMRALHLDAVEMTGTSLRLVADAVVDLDVLTRAAEAVLDRSTESDPTAIGELVRAGDVLPDWSDDWLVVERERFRQLRLHALERAAARLAADGRIGRAIDICVAVVAEEPLRDSAQRMLIELHLAEGNHVEAVRQYRTFWQLIEDEVGIEPSSETQALVAPVLESAARPTVRGLSAEPARR